MRTNKLKNENKNLPKWVKRTKYNGFIAHIKRNEIEYYLGTYNTPDEAHLAALNFAKN